MWSRRVAWSRRTRFGGCPNHRCVPALTIHAYHPRAPSAQAHQPLDAAMTEPMATLHQGALHSRTAVRPAATLEDYTHLFEENPVVPRVRARRSFLPRVVAPSRDPEHSTEPRHAEPRPFPVDEREGVGLRAPPGAPRARCNA